MCNITIQEKNNGHFHTGHYLKGYENIYSSLEEIEFDECYIIPNDIDNSDECPYSSALDFLHGACHLFAYMLYQLFGYEVFKIKTENNDSYPISNNLFSCVFSINISFIFFSVHII